LANSTISVHIYHLSGKKYKHTYEYIKRGPFANELPGGPNVILPIHEKCASAQVKAWICFRKGMQRSFKKKKCGIPSSGSISVIRNAVLCIQLC